MKIRHVSERGEFTIAHSSIIVRLGRIERRDGVLGSTVLHPDGLRRLAITLEVVSENLLEKYGEASYASVIDFFDFVAH